MRRVILGLLLFASCGRSEEEAREKSSPLLTSPSAAPRPADVAKAASDPDELLRALALPYGETSGKLGAHRLRGTSKLRVVENAAEIEKLDETQEIDFAADGAFHAKYANSKEYGREAFHQQGTLWLRPLFGKFHKRPIVDAKEPGELLDQIGGTVGAQLDLVGAFVQVKDGGAANVAGRDGRKLILSNGSKRKRPPKGNWRDEISVPSLDGELVLDNQTGALLSARLATTVAFVREGRSFTMSLEATQELTDVGGAVTITPPPDAESVATPTRSTEFEDREELLTGIAPPARRSPTPAAETKPAGGTK